MKLLELNLKDFGKFHDKTVELLPGMNIIQGKNEAGKSTIHSFIFAMFYGLEGSERKQRIYDHYLPWDNTESYGGSMRFEEGGHTYLLQRSFLKDNAYITLKDETTGEDITSAEEALKKLLGGLTESGYRNTVSIGQMESATDENLFLQLQSSIASLGMAKNMEISLERVSDSLMRKRKELEKRISPGSEKEKEQLLASISVTERELFSQIEKASRLEEELKEGRAREYEEFSEKLQERDQLKKQMEDINQEHSRLLHEKERWQKARDGARGQLEKGIDLFGESDFEDAKLSISMASPPPGIFAIGIVVLILAILSFFCYVGLIPLIGKGASWSLYLGCVALGLSIMLILLAMHLKRKHKRHLSFYRLLADKNLRFKEAAMALDTVESKRDQLLGALTQDDEEGYGALHAKNEELEKEIMRLEWEQEQTVNRLNAQKVQLAIATSLCKSNKRLRDEIKAVSLALENIFVGAEKIQDTFGDEMNEKASGYIEKLTEGTYTELLLKGADGVFLRAQNRLVPLDKLSRGTIEQVYLSIRLAAAECLSPNVVMPLLLDDTFAFYDDQRTKRAMELLRASDRQVLILTCQGREKKIFNE